MVHSLGDVLGVILLGKNRILGSRQECASKRVCTLCALQGIRFQRDGETFSKESPSPCSPVGREPGQEWGDYPTIGGVCSLLRSRKRGVSMGRAHSGSSPLASL